MYKSIKEQPTIHLQFKTPNDLYLIKNSFIKTSPTSIALKEKVNFSELPGYQEGKWWIQDYAATIPVKLMGNIKNKNILDMCSAPGGKTFQLINLGANVTAFDKSIKKIAIMKKIIATK